MGHALGVRGLGRSFSEPVSNHTELSSLNLQQGKNACF